MKKTIRTLSITAIIAIPVLVLIFYFISQSNTEVELRNEFSQKISERTSFYDKMWKILDQKTQIALRNDSSFRENVNIIMSGRKDAPQVFFKWIVETNPNANFQEVSALYKDLSRAVEAEREGFFNQEKVLQDIKRQHDNLRKRFPSTVVMAVLGRHQLPYTPVTSDRTDDVFKTHKENNTKLL